MACRLCSQNKSSSHGRHLTVATFGFRRSLGGSFLTAHLPTIIANIIGHLTNWFHVTNFDTAVGVNLTLLLVLTTMYECITVWLRFRVKEPGS